MAIIPAKQVHSTLQGTPWNSTALTLEEAEDRVNRAVKNLRAGEKVDVNFLDGELNRIIYVALEMNIRNAGYSVSQSGNGGGTVWTIATVESYVRPHYDNFQDRKFENFFNK